jgi:hypothetical protein
MFGSKPSLDGHICNNVQHVLFLLSWNTVPVACYTAALPQYVKPMSFTVMPSRRCRENGYAYKEDQYR